MMLKRYFDWTTEIEPSWCGFVVFTISWIALGFSSVALVLVAIGATRGWALAVIPAIIAYCFYVAIFKQQKDETE
jgi:hypothetical protein